jgi:hypothetical protein
LRSDRHDRHDRRVNAIQEDATPRAGSGCGSRPDADLSSERCALRVGHALQCVLAIVCRLIRRPPLAGIPGSLLGFRDRAATLLITRGWRITAATVAGNLALWLVLLACLRGTGLSQAQVPWQASLAAFAVVRLLTALLVTPGGVGITEFGLVTILAGAGHQTSV